MIYYSTEKLELPKIISRLEEQCATALGKELVHELAPSNHLPEIKRWQQETTEACDCLRLYPGFSLGGIRDIRGHLWRVSRGGVLSPHELLEVLDTLQASKRLKKFFAGIKEGFPTLKAIAQGLTDFSGLERDISHAISEDGKVKDDASPTLYRLRRRKLELQDNIKRKLESIIHSGEYQKMLQDALITIRGDRYVIPVKQEYRSRFPGLVHDQSASGATLFIEPMAIVELNNELRQVQLEENREVEAILVTLSQKTGSFVPELEATLEALGRLDFVFAKAKLSYTMNGAEPSFNTSGFLRLVKGRHPLISGRVVPLDLELGKHYRTLVITGPNTGGKTVALKTAGLLCLMAQCGLHIPAEPSSSVPVFDKIFADIGDEQSIEQSLSTFSSHMKNLVFIVNEADANSLILLDELGAGTDPAEGSALAMAILSTLHGRGARIIATTHYSELKAFAYSSPGIENASVEFDAVSLKPTYRLLIGTPGRSNAFEIAARLGLDPQIVELARTYITRDELEVGALLEDLEARRLRLEKEQDEMQVLRAEAAALKQQLENEREALHEKELQILDEARQKAKLIIDEAQTVMRSLINDIRQAAKLRERREQERAIEEARRKLHEFKEKTLSALESTSKEYQKNAPATVSPGEQVMLVKLRQKGVVLEPPNSQGEVLVQVGIMKVQVPLHELRSMEEERKEQLTGTINKLVMHKSRQISPELDLRGCTVDEALALTEKYLDDAMLSSLSTIYLIHGKGTGTLRAAIHELLESQPQVKGFRLGHPHEGGAGVTVVEFK
ncbi:MAG TPA: endonuclease MutS2 [Clostridia bacterium]|nr:endonuclease MutS2 [Clostridia bacterium]